MAEELFKRTGVRYEVACDVIGSIIAHYAEILGQQYQLVNPDQAIIERSRAQQRILRVQRDELDPKDGNAIEATIMALGPVARAFYGK